MIYGNRSAAYSLALHHDTPIKLTGIISRYNFLFHGYSQWDLRFWLSINCRSAKQRRQEEEDMALAHALAASEEEARRSRNRVLNFFVAPAKN